MIDIRKNAEAILKEVSETQKKAIQACRTRVKRVTDAPACEMYGEGVSAYRDIVKYNMKHQTRLSESVVHRITDMEGFPEQAKDSVVRLQKLSSEMVTSQEELLNNVCDLMAKLDPKKATEYVTEVFEDPARRIRETTEKTVALERELIDALTKGIGVKPAPKKTAPKAKKAPTATKRTTGTAKKPKKKAASTSPKKATSTARKKTA